MSIGKNAALLTLFFCLFAFSSSALSIRVLPGGIPVGSADQLMAEGIRLGSSQILRQAWDAYERALVMNPEYLDGYIKMGRIYFHLSLLGSANDADFQKAHQFAGKLLKKAPALAESHRLMGEVLSGKGAYLDAMEELQLALQMNPGSEFVLCDMASIHLALHQPDQTIKLLEGKSLKDGWSLYILGMAWFQKGEKGRALINFKKSQKRGLSGYWLEMALDRLAADLSLPSLK